MKKKRSKKTEIIVRADRCALHKVKAKEPKLSDVKKFFNAVSRLLYDFLYSFVLHYFMAANRKARSKLTVWCMKCETSQHLPLMMKVFKRLVLPASFLYVFMAFCFFRENVLDSMLLGMLIFFYSSFLPDLPSIYREKDKRNNEDLFWEEKFALLLFAPIFIAAFFCGIGSKWKTAETFHNFKSLTVYAAFLFVLGFFAFGDFPISIGDVTEVLSLPFYGLIGYLTHLKVDKVW